MRSKEDILGHYLSKYQGWTTSNNDKIFDFISFLSKSLFNFFKVKGGSPFFTPKKQYWDKFAQSLILFSSASFYPILTLIGYFFQDFDELFIFEKICKI